MQLKISAVAPVVLTAGELLPQKTHDGERHVRTDFLRDFYELLKVDAWTTSEAEFQDRQHLLQRINTLLKVLDATTLFCKIALASHVGTLINRHAANDGYDVVGVDQAIVVEVVDVKNQFYFVVKI
jgi:hypothetical protein